MAHDDVPVVIIGGSLVGLSTAVFLGAQGVPSLVIERHPGTDPPAGGASVTEAPLVEPRGLTKV